MPGEKYCFMRIAKPLGKKNSIGPYHTVQNDETRLVKYSVVISLKLIGRAEMEMELIFLFSSS